MTCTLPAAACLTLTRRCHLHVGRHGATPAHSPADPRVTRHTRKRQRKPYVAARVRPHHRRLEAAAATVGDAHALDYKASPNRVWGKLAGAEPIGRGYNSLRCRHTNACTRDYVNIRFRRLNGVCPGRRLAGLSPRASWGQRSAYSRPARWVRLRPGSFALQCRCHSSPT